MFGTHEHTVKLQSAELTSRPRSIVFLPGYGGPVKTRFRKKPINYAAFLRHFPNLTSVRGTTSLDRHRKTSRIHLPDLETLDMLLPSPLLGPTATEPSIIRTLILRHLPSNALEWRYTQPDIAQTLQPLAAHVEELWIHLDSTVVWEPKRNGFEDWGAVKGREKRLPVVLDSVRNVRWASLRSVGLVVNLDGWCSTEGHPWPFVSTFPPIHLLNRTKVSPKGAYHPFLHLLTGGTEPNRDPHVPLRTARFRDRSFPLIGRSSTALRLRLARRSPSDRHARASVISRETIT